MKRCKVKKEQNAKHNSDKQRKQEKRKEIHNTKNFRMKIGDKKERKQQRQKT